MTNQPVLKGIRILDFTWVLAGPYATRLLADFGAEVLKVQPLPPQEQEDDAFARGYYNTWNRNKRGITLNMAKPGGIALAEKLVALSDAVVENFTPRVMANWGMDYASLKKLKPDIIMLSLSTMGNTGPRKDYSGFGPTVQAFSGLTHLTAYPAGPPLGPGTAHADHVAALFACLALLGALEHRRRTGEGQHIDISQVEAMASLLGDAFMPPQESATCGVYRCKGEDRWCAVSVSTEDEWRGFKKALGNLPWAEEERFDTLASRLANKKALDRLIGEWTQKHTDEEAMTLLQKQGVAAGAVQSARDLARDPQLKHRGFFVELDHPETGRAVSDANPIRLSETPPRYRPAPLLGQDNGYIYGELLGLSQGEMNKLKEQGVI
ncbi:MAG TPA: CoA transferase [Dehalococcoidales bacterium]|nr:CoA transferase [Dehalococcoidales bacterium]